MPLRGEGIDVFFCRAKLAGVISVPVDWASERKAALSVPAAPPASPTAAAVVPVPARDQGRPRGPGQKRLTAAAQPPAKRLKGPAPAVPPAPGPALASAPTAVAVTEAELVRAAEALGPGAAPANLPCREAQQREVGTFLRTAISAGRRPQMLCLSGMPGTGKTSSLLQVVREMREEQRVPDFDFVHVNAMKLSHAGAVFGEIAAQLTDVASDAAWGGGGAAGCAARTYEQVTQRLAAAGGAARPVLLFVDELDCLVTRNQAVVYRLFDWLSLPGARLVITAISNTLDLRERLLPRVASRVGMERVDFPPYTRAELHTILRARLKARGVAATFDDRALELASARVAAGSGDVRKALQVCRHAAEARRGEPGPVGIDELQASQKVLMHGCPSFRAVAALDARARCLLLATVLALEPLPLRRLADAYRSVAVSVLPAAHQSPDELLCEEASRIVRRLHASGLLVSVGPQAAVGLGPALDRRELATALRSVEGDNLEVGRALEELAQRLLQRA